VSAIPNATGTNSACAASTHGSLSTCISRLLETIHSVPFSSSVMLCRLLTSSCICYLVVQTFRQHTDPAGEEPITLGPSLSVRPLKISFPSSRHPQFPQRVPGNSLTIPGVPRHRTKPSINHLCLFCLFCIVIDSYHSAYQHVNSTIWAFKIPDISLFPSIASVME